MPHKLTRHMTGILFILYEEKKFPVRSVDLIPTALVRLATEGYVRIGRRPSLTEEGRKLVESGTLTRPEPSFSFPYIY